MTLEAVSNIKFSDLKLNLDMNNILREYPPSCVLKNNRLAWVKPKTVSMRRSKTVSMRRSTCI